MHALRTWLALVAAVLVATAGIGVYLGHARAATASADAVAVRLTDRFRKAAMVEQMSAPPQVLILGGSRALRFDPAYLARRTGLLGFNAAVTGARPEDAWAFVSLVHQRFPAARLRFLWVIHADEFDPKPIDPALVNDPVLSRFFPPAALAAQPSFHFDAIIRVDPTQLGRVFAPDGMTLSDAFGRGNPVPGRDGWIVRRRIHQELRQYARRTPRLSARSCRYFEQTLGLMARLDRAPPVVVAAPVDARIFRATAARGWGVRHQMVLAFLARLRRRYRFDFVDLSRAARCGCTPADFYDGIHLRPSGARKVIDQVLRLFPGAL